MEHTRNVNACPEEHVIVVTGDGTISSSTPSGDAIGNPSDLQREDPPPSSSQPSHSESSVMGSTARTTPFRRRGDNNGRHGRSPLNSGLWISIELLVNLSQIIAAVTVLSCSRHEKPKTPLFAWIVVYTSGCVIMIPHLYWRYAHRNSQNAAQGSPRRQSISSSNNFSVSFPAAPVAQVPSAVPGLDSGNRNRRLNSLVDHIKMALDCFFAVWFVVGNVWIFGGQTSASSAPNLYRLCIVFLIFSCIGYAMPFILCATICCCLPCIIALFGLREDLNHNGGAATDIINALPTYKYKSARAKSKEDGEIGTLGSGEGGFFAAGTDKERAISAEDAVCSICLAKYVDNDVIRELTCSHFFHMECVDKWLNINSTCPLCKAERLARARVVCDQSKVGRNYSLRVGLANTIASGYPFTDIFTGLSLKSDRVPPPRRRNGFSSRRAVAKNMNGISRWRAEAKRMNGISRWRAEAKSILSCKMNVALLSNVVFC